VIEQQSLLSLEAYARERASFRAKVIEHKKVRTIPLGPDVTLQFEDELLIRYQIQEMLRLERIFEEDAIRHELDTYAPLVPDGSNWKPTMFIEFPDADERRRELAKLKGIEHRVWVQIGDGERIYAIADEDLERENDEKTSAVHFLRFELGAQADVLKHGAKLAMGIDHPAYQAVLDPVPPQIRAALAQDLA
jgi:hypothetical protein